jgi:hypothetical protein
VLFVERVALKLVGGKRRSKQYFGLLNDLVEVVLRRERWLAVLIHHLIHPREVKKVVLITKVA